MFKRTEQRSGFHMTDLQFNTWQRPNITIWFPKRWSDVPQPKVTAKRKGLTLPQCCDLPDIFRLITSHKAPCYSLSDSLVCIKVHGQGAAKSLLQPNSCLHRIPASLHPSHSRPLRDDWRGVGDKVSRTFRILSALGIGGQRVAGNTIW